MPTKDRNEQRVSRGMPNNINAENAVLGAILIDDKAADMLIPTLKKDDFYLAANRTIFGVMKELQEASVPIDTVSVSDALDRAGKLDEVGSISYLSELAEGIPSAANCEYYADIVRRDSLSRRVIEAGNDIAKFGYESENGVAALEKAEQIVYGIAEQNSPKELLHAGTALAEAVNNIQELQQGHIVKNVIYTDFPHFDHMTHGLKPGEIILLAARPSVGKTALALNIAANSALNHGKRVAVFSLEMPADLLAKRMLAYVSKVEFDKMNVAGGMNSGDFAKLFKAYNALLASEIYLDDYSMNSPSDVLSKCRRLKREKGLDFVIIDYLQLMSSGARAESRQNEVSSMSRQLKIYAKELNCPILVLSQMSRDVEKRDAHTPQLSDLRESGAIEQDADVVAFLSNPSKYNNALPEDQVILDVKKNRNGAIGEVKLKWDGNTTSFMEYEDQNADFTKPKDEYVSVEDAENKAKKAAEKGAKEAGVALTNGAVEVPKPQKSQPPAIEKPIENADFGENKEGKLEKLDEVAGDMQEVLSAEELPFGDFDDVPAPSDEDVPFDVDDEYVDEGDGDIEY
ncbi:MAG: replicative DNA helicase [Clostridia bacterium]|nr:replicative DNA helicase [Clostridia bacterium]